MKTRFRVIIKRDDNDQLEAIYIPSLQFQMEFSGDSQELMRFKHMQQQHYLEDKIYSLIEKRKANQEKIEDSSTVALMTQGFSELSAPSHTYDIYFVEREKDIKPSEIDGIAMIFVGNERTRKVFIVSNNDYYYKDNKKCCLRLTLTESQMEVLKDIQFNAKESARITMENCQVINDLKKNIIKKLGWIYLGPNSYTLDVSVYDHERRPCSFFSVILPPFTRVTMFTQLALSTILDLGFMDASDNPFFPPEQIIIRNSTTGNITDIIFRANPFARPFNISQVAFGLAMSMLFILAGPRQRSVRGLGLQMDDMFIWLYRKLCGSKLPNKDQKPKAKCTWSNIKISLTKGFFFLLVLDQMLLMTLMSYLRLKMLTDKINGNEDSLFPPEFIKDVSITQWALAQLQDPMIIMGESALIFFIIENYFRPINLLNSINKLAAEKKEMASNQQDEKKALLAPEAKRKSSEGSPESKGQKEIKVNIDAEGFSNTPFVMFSTKSPQVKVSKTSEVPVNPSKTKRSCCLVM